MINTTSMIKKPTCYKNPDKPTCIDLILTNCAGSFQNSCVIETGFSYFHKMVVALMNTSYRKIEPRVTGIIRVSLTKGLENRHLKT